MSDNLENRGSTKVESDKNVLRRAIGRLERYQRLLDELNSRGKYQYVDENPKDILATRDELVRVKEGMENGS